MVTTSLLLEFLLGDFGHANHVPKFLCCFGRDIHILPFLVF